MMGAMAVASTAFAYTVTPSEGWQPQIENKVVISFDDAVTIVKADAPLVSYNIGVNNETLNCNRGMELQADGNNLVLAFTRADEWTLKPGLGKPFTSMSSMTGGKTMGDPCPIEFTIPAGSYQVAGVDGEALTISYLLSTEKPAVSFDYNVTPAEGWQQQIENKIVFSFDAPVGIVKADAPLVSYNIGVNNETLNCNRGMELQADGNNLVLAFTRADEWTLKPGLGKPFTSMSSMTGGKTMGDPCPIEFTIPAGAFTVDGEANTEPIVVKYTLSTEDPNPATANVTASPAEGVLAEPTKIFNFAFEGEIASSNYDFVTVECMTTAGVKTFTGSEQYLSTEILLSPNMTVTCAKNVEIGATGVFSADQTDPLAAGDVIFTIPAGTYTLNGEPGPEVKITYTLEAEPEPEAKTTITPEADSHNAALPEVVINFGEGKVPAWTSGSPSIYWNGLPGSNAAGKYFSLTNGAAKEGYKCEYSVRDNSLVITMPNEGITPGMYEFSISNYTVNEKAGEKLSFNIYVDEPNMENAQALEFTVDPATNAIQPNSIQNLVLTFAEGSNAVLVKPFKGGISYSLESAEDAVTSVDNWFNGYVFGNNRAEGNKVYFGNTSAIPNPNGKTNLWIHFSEGTFMVDGVYNEAVTLEYYLAAPEYFDYDAEPAAGSTTWSLDFMSLEFFDVDTEEMTFELAEDAKGQLKRNGAVMENYDVLLNVYENFLQMMVVDSATQEEAAVMEPGHYQVVIPAGSFFIDGLGNSEISLAYEIAYQEAAFTANPENGATVRGISSVELTFEDDVEIEALEAATYVMLGGAKINAEYVGEGNKLTVSLDTPVYASYNEETGNYSWTGEKNFIIPEGFFTIFGREAAQIELTYNFDYNVALPTFDFTVNPEEGTVEELEGEFVLSFYNAKTRADISAGAMIEGVQLLRNGEAVENVEVMAGMMFGGDCYEMQVSLFDEEYNTLLLTEEGTYTLVIPAGAFTSYGVENEEIRLTYKVDKSVNVEGLAADGVKVTVYDAQGRIILKDADAKELNSLKGLFIVNGKKQIRK